MLTDPSLADVVAALEAVKQAVLPPAWSPRRQQPNVLAIRAPLTVDGIVQAGLTVHLQCDQGFPDERVAISLLLEGAIKPLNIARVDWLGSAHSNPLALAGSVQFLDAGQSHFHDPRYCPTPGHIEAFLRGNVPSAVALQPEPPDFPSLLAQASVLLNITNLMDVPVPPWQPRSLLSPPTTGSP